MKKNPIIETMLSHKSIRKYTDEMPSKDVIETIVRAGQQAPFATQCYSIIVSKDPKKNAYKAPIMFTICVDPHKFELIMEKRNWKMIMSDIGFLLLAIQDAALMTQNMILAARSLRLGSCLLGNAPNIADRIAEQYSLPDRVFPLVQLVMGFPAEDPPPRPRYPLEFTLFEDKYPKLNAEAVKKAMKQMDDGYLAQDYYRRQNAKIQLEAKRKETHTYDTYSWTEHISRKLGQWLSDPEETLEQFEKRGFYLTRKRASTKA